jgi:hypothetical protein
LSSNAEKHLEHAIARATVTRDKQDVSGAKDFGPPSATSFCWVVTVGSFSYRFEARVGTFFSEKEWAHLEGTHYGPLQPTFQLLSF